VIGIYLDYSIHPTLNTQYFFPKRQADLTVANNRRNSTFIVPGGGGPVNPKGLSPFDREPNIITYLFQINPIGDRTRAVDTTRDAFLQAIDHGIPQTLAFHDDNGQTWFATCVLTEDPHHQMASSDASHTIQASWVMLTDYLRAPATPGTAIYGGPLYGTVIYGRVTTNLNLASAVNQVVLDNTNTGATAPTTDPVFTISGPFAPGGGHTSSFGDSPLAVYCYQSGYGFVLDLGLGASDTLVVDLASRRVTLNDQPAFNHLRRWPSPTAQAYMMILPNSYNTIQIWIGDGVNVPVTTGGLAKLEWHPKRSL
jgi:hypothetical protein